MEYDSGLQKYGADKLALLGMFILGLFIAYLISTARYDWPRSAAIEMTNRIKNKGLSSILAKTGWEKFFLVKDAHGRPAGFTMEIFIEERKNQRFNIKSAAHYYIKGLYTEEQKTFFQTNEHLEEFLWQSRTITPRGSKLRVISLSKDSILTIRQSEPRPKITFKIKPATLPSPVLDLAFSQMLEGKIDKIALDVIQSNGSVVPMLISRENIKSSENEKQNRKYKFRLEIPLRRNFLQYIYLDGNKKISGIIMKRPRKYVLERGTVSEILKYFPDKASYLFDREMEPESEDEFFPQMR